MRLLCCDLFELVGVVWIAVVGLAWVSAMGPISFSQFLNITQVLCCFSTSQLEA